MRLAVDIWSKHIEIFKSFDLICNNGDSLEDETKSNALFNALVTLELMKNESQDILRKAELSKSIRYLKNSKHYSDSNKDSSY